MSNTCFGYCTEHVTRVSVSRRGLGAVFKLFNYCTTCQVYLPKSIYKTNKGGKISCICCNYPLRTRSRYTETRHAYQQRYHYY